MKINLLSYLMALFFVSFFRMSAQTVSIPDQGFEQELIYGGIDSDGQVNGQILTADAENVTELFLYGDYMIYDLTGIEAFVNLEVLVITQNSITEINVSQLLNLRVLDCSVNALTAIDVSANALLEELYIGNDYDVGGNAISVVDLSNNPNIHTFNAVDNGLILEEVYLTTGNNNQNMNIYIGAYLDYNPSEPLYNTCLFVDDTEAAQNNEFPYSEWEINNYNVTYSFVDDCGMSSNNPETLSFSIYPNPVKDILRIDAADQPIDKIILYDNLGRKILEEAGAEELSVSHLAPGSYMLKIVSGKRVQSKKILIN